MKPVTLSSPRFFMHGYRRLKQLTAILSLLVFPATWGNWGVLTAQEVGGGMTAEDINRVVNSLTEFTHTISSRLVTMESMVESLDRDPVKITQWLKEHTQWVPYHGYMKGPSSVFEDRMGSSLDRTVLLAQMLLLAGKPVKIFRGNTDFEGRKALMNELTLPENWEDWSVSNLGIEARVKQKADELKTLSGSTEQQDFELLGHAGAMVHEMDIYKDALLEAVSAQTNRLKQGLVLPSDGANVDVGAFAENYCYVAYQGEGGWVGVCPLFGTDIPEFLKSGLSDVTSFSSSEEIPEALTHRLKIRLLVDRYSDGKETEKTALEQEWRVPQINLSQVSLVIQGSKFESIAEALSADDSDFDGKQSAAKSLVVKETHWRPGFVTASGESNVEYEFDVHGEVRKLEPDALGQKKAIGRATGMLGALNFGAASEEPAARHGTLSGVRVEYVTIAPMGVEHVTKRVLFALSEEEKRYYDEHGEVELDANERRAFSCTRTTDIFVQAGKLTENGFRLKQVEFVNAFRLPLKYLARNLDSESDAMNAIFKVYEKLPRWDLMLPSLASARSVLPHASKVTYFNQTNLLTVNKQLVLQDGQIAALSGFDILINKLASLRGAPSDLVEMGVFDTIAENTILRASTGNQKSWMTGLAFEEHMAAGDIIRVDAENFENTKGIFCESVISLVERDIADFGVVIVSNQPDSRAWYRVSETTGETLGVGVSGFGYSGSPSTEYVVTKQVALIALGKGAVAGAISFFGCHQVGSGGIRTFAGCLVCSIFMAAAVFVGSMLSPFGGEFAAASYGGEVLGGLCLVGVTQMGN